MKSDEGREGCLCMYYTTVRSEHGVFEITYQAASIFLLKMTAIIGWAGGVVDDTFPAEPKPKGGSQWSQCRLQLDTDEFPKIHGGVRTLGRQAVWTEWRSIHTELRSLGPQADMLVGSWLNDLKVACALLCIASTRAEKTREE